MANLIDTGTINYGGAVLETSGGTKYLVLGTSFAGTTVTVYKDIDGTATEYNEGGDNIFGGTGTGVAGWVDAALDSNDDIHIVASGNSEDTRDVSYCVFDTGTNTFGTWEQALDYSEAAPTLPRCAISIDSNDYPHIHCVDYVKQTGASQDNVYYTERTGGSWSTPTQIGVRSDKNDVHNLPKITVRNSDYVTVLYRRFASSAFTACYRHYTTSWSGELTISIGTPIIGDVTSTTAPTIAFYNSTTSGYNIYEGTSDTGYDTYSSGVPVSPALSGTTRYIFYIDSNVDIHAISNSGSGWTDEGAVEAGTYLSIVAEWAYNNLNQTSGINLAFHSTTGIYYSFFAFATTHEAQATLAVISGTMNVLEVRDMEGNIIHDWTGGGGENRYLCGECFDGLAKDIYRKGAEIIV